MHDGDLDPTFVDFQLALAGRYSIERELGRGGMGIVYLAREVHLDRLVAIKLLPPDRATPSLRERFLGEAQLAARLSHPGIVPIHAVEESGRFTYFVMALVDGETLTQRVRTRGPLGASDGARVIREVAWALAYAHEQGVVHRDVKPDNILLEHGSGRAVVADFGIAAASGAADAHSVAGTPEFMSPEQVIGMPLDARSDLYSLGATAYFAFTGRLAIEGATAAEVMARQVTDVPAAVGSLGPGVPRDVAALVHHCLDKDPAQRPGSARAVAERLGLVLERRRELPVALRAFVRHSARLDGGGTLAGAIVVSSATVASALTWGPAGAVAALTVGALLPLGYLVASAKRLCSLGFSHRDLPETFRAERERTEEELSHAVAGPRSAVERWAPAALRISTVLLVGGIAGTKALIATQLPYSAPPDARALHQLAFDVANGALMLGTLGVPLMALVALGVRRLHRDLDTAFWSRLWTGPVGRLAFALARRLPGMRVVVPALTHRATELALAMAAEQLFASLPAAMRQQLGDVPSVVGRLQEDATAMRSRLALLHDALTGSGAAAGADAYRDASYARDVVQARLAEVVTALETIRLDLLRLHAGTDRVPSLTTHLRAAAELAAEVERAVAARAEVEGLLRFPREAASTPV